MEVKDFNLKLHRRGGEVSVFEISDQDDSGTTQYFGWLNGEGNWIIQKYDTAASPKTMRYSSGQSGYSTAWTGRAALTYDYYNTIH